MAALLGVERKRYSLGNFRLASGAVLPDAALAYETYGQLAPGGRNAVLITHGYTNHHHAAGRYAESDAAPGWWDAVIGPGKPIDTDQLFVVSSNMLGSSWGSTGPKDIDPRTGQPYGPDFPDLSLLDIVTAQRRLLQGLGVTQLVAVAGQSYGGFQAFQWGVAFPDFMSGLVVVCSAPKGRSTLALEETRAALAADPAWNGGRHYERGGMLATMTALRLRTLHRYGHAEVLAARHPDPAAREAALRRLAEEWARSFDPNSLIVLGKAAARFDVTADFTKIRAKLLYVLCSTDKLFPAAIAPEVMATLDAAGVDARFHAIDSAHGHAAHGSEPEKWARVLREFMDRLLAAAA